MPGPTENHIRLNADYYENIIQSSDDAIVSKSLDGIIESWNPGAETIFGYTASEMIGQSMLVLFPPERLDEENIIIEQIKQGKKVVHFETERLRKDHKLIHVSVTISPIFNSKRQVIGASKIARDVTGRKQAESRLRESEERLVLASIHNGVGIWDWDLTTRELVWDDSMFALYHIQRNNFSGAVDAWKKSLHPDDQERCSQEINAAIYDNQPFETEFRVVWPNKEVRYIKAVAKVFRSETGKPIRMLGTNLDITERKILEDELKRQARVDFLTDVCNRRYFMEQAEQEFSRTARYGNNLTLLMIDIDSFKQINDSYGHKAGDTVLKKLAEISLRILREVDTIGRIGGEEFAILLRETLQEGAMEVAERLREAFADEQINLEGQKEPIHFTVSMGLATLNMADKSIDSLLSRADKALYGAKRTGKNKVCIAGD
jgi:diguanylate cyclase (GGDEF)-like protein/PAS domain S-box-containing protein